MKVNEILWKDVFVEKLLSKHGVETNEVEEILFGRPLVRYWKKGKVAGENLYVAYGQTNAGRYLIVFFIQKTKAIALPISARDMTSSERRYFTNEKRN